MGILLGYLNWVLLFPHFLDKEEMGLVRIFLDTGILLSTIFGAAVNQTLIKHYPYKEGGFNRSYLIRYGLIALSSLLLLSIFFFSLESELKSFFSKKAALFDQYFHLVYGIILFQMMFDFFESLNKIRLNISSATLIKEVLLKAMLLLFVAGYGLGGYPLHILLWGIIIAFAIQWLLMCVLFFRKWNPDHSALRFQKPSKEEFTYLFYMFLGSGSSVLVTQIDTIMTGGMKSLQHAAVYAMAVFMSNVVYMPFRTFTSISTPLLSNYYAQNLRSKIADLYKNSSNTLFFLGAFIFLAIWFNIDFIFSLIPEKNDGSIRFSDGKWVLFLIGMSRLLDMISGVNAIILVHSKHYRLHFYTMPILAILTIGGNLLLIPRFDLIGAAIATLISISLFNFLRFILLWWKEKLQPFTWQTLYVVLLFSLCLLPSFMPIPIEGIGRIFLSGIWIICVFILPNYVFGFTPELRNFIDKRIRKDAGIGRDK